MRGMIKMAYYLNGKPATEYDKQLIEEAVDNEVFYYKHCVSCYYQYKCVIVGCEAVDIDYEETTYDIKNENFGNIDKCGYKCAFEWKWQIVSPGNEICKDCGQYIICSSGKCPTCGSLNTKQIWKRVKIYGGR